MKIHVITLEGTRVDSRAIIYAYVKTKISVESLDKVKRDGDYATFNMSLDPLEL